MRFLRPLCLPLFALALGAGTTGAAPAVAPGGDAEASYARFRTTLDHGDPPAQALDRFALEVTDPGWRLRARVVAAERAYRGGDAALAVRLLAQRDAGAGAASPFLGAYADYLTGLLKRDQDPAAAHRSFLAAFEGAGDSLLRHRAGIW